jgi:hypothetical protein
MARFTFVHANAVACRPELASRSGVVEQLLAHAPITSARLRKCRLSARRRSMFGRLSLRSVARSTVGEARFRGFYE